jgi:maltose phosphorylase
MAKIPTKYLLSDPWAIIEKDFHPSEGRVSESIFSLANEYMGVRGYFDEGYSGDQLIGSYVNGVWSEIDIKHAVMYKGLATNWTFMVNAVEWLYTRISLDGETLDLAKSSFENFSRTLDLRNGIYTREFVWTTKSGKKLKLTFTRFTSMIVPNLGCQQVTFEALNFDGPVEVVTGLDFSTIHESIHNKNYWNIAKEETNGIWLSLLGKTERSNIGLFSSFALEGDFLDVEPAFFQDKKIVRRGYISLIRNTPVSLNKLVINYTDKKVNGDLEQIWHEGKKITGKLSELTFESALKQHKSHWSQVWEDLDIEIDGDMENQQGIRYCLFQLYQTNHGQDPANNVGAKGLTGEIYSGHTFWDTEAYCLPFYLFTNPTAAKNLLLFRHKTLAQAKEWSIEQNCEGACYPMETIDGRESCPVWWHGNLEIHVPGAVGYGIWHYHKITGDDEFLYNEGIEMLSEICRFYASRGNWREDGFGFYGVMGPDEFHTFVNNNYYTNLLAKKLFRFTLETLDKMGNQPRKPFMPGAAESAQWKKMADTMILPKNQETGVYEQHEGYFLLPHLDIHSIPVEDFPLYHSWTLPRIYRYDMIKQPDVLLSLFFFSHDYTQEEKKANYEYYEQRCIHESSLSPSVHSILAAELGKKEEADQFFDYATRLDLDNYNRNTREGLHTTSIAAAWLNIVYGFAGMRSDGDLLSFKPTIPVKWKSYTFSIVYREIKIRVKVDQEKATFKAVGGSFEVMINNEKVKLSDTELEMKNQ